MDPSIGYFTVIMQDQSFDKATNKSNTVAKNLTVQQCGYQYFNFSDSAIITQAGINNQYCVTNDYSLQGQSIFSLNSKYLEVKLWKCQNTTANNSNTNPILNKPVGNQNIPCKPQGVIDSYLANETFSFLFVN